ncbi:hypothetical protein ABPG72_005912 [Tetrahymena utriculariae]
MENIAEIKEQNLIKYKVIVWDNEGMNKSQISKELGIDRKQVYRILEKFEQTGSVEIDLRQFNGKKLIFDNEMKDELKELIKNENLRNFLDISERVKQELMIDASDSTIRNVLKEIGRFIIPSWSPIFTLNHIQQRLQFCKYHRNRKTNFKHVIFTDESRFYINRKTRKEFTLKGEQIPVKQKQNPDFSVMVWGAISYEGALYLEIIDGSLNQNNYLEILSNFFEDQEPQFGVNRYWKFQQDGAPAHRPKAVSDFIKENGYQIHIHPPNSPDLNPIEKIWGYMKQSIEKKVIHNKTELEDAIFEEWESLSLSKIQSSIDQLKQQIKLVIDEEGGLPQRKVN